MTKLTRMQSRLRQQQARELAGRAPGFRLPGGMNTENMTPEQIAVAQNGCHAIERAMCDVLAAARRAVDPLGDLIGMERAEPLLRDLERVAGSIMEAVAPIAVKSGLQ